MVTSPQGHPTQSFNKEMLEGCQTHQSLKAPMGACEQSSQLLGGGHSAGTLPWFPHFRGSLTHSSYPTNSSLVQLLPCSPGGFFKRTKPFPKTKFLKIPIKSALPIFPVMTGVEGCHPGCPCLQPLSEDSGLPTGSLLTTHLTLVLSPWAAPSVQFPAVLYQGTSPSRLSWFY
ncbi:hypothetical protein KIL84_015617 [Mauremys mutica]|uniref:Uncharacterized protein n=1 Tax=Mauremys mutica TaxID=74926 RepID=A0A9D3WST9_9SAUR|nr:hypothetical protein KIL84_015617 [Mauremys mutica]